MKKRFRALLLAALTILSLTGCSVNVPEETVEPTVPAPVEVEVPYEPEQEVKKYEGVQLRLLSTHWDTDPEAAVMLQAAEAFEKQTGAQVQILWAADASAGTEGCDIFQTGLEKLEGSLLSGTLDLGAMAETAGYSEKSFDALRKQVTAQCGYLAGIPQIPAVGGVYYVQDVFSAAGIDTVPRTWRDFLTVSQSLKDAGFEPLVLNKEDEPLAAWLHFERSFGDAYLAKDPENKTRFADDEKLVEAAQQILDYISGGNLLTAAMPGGQNKLGLSNAAMTLGTNQMCTQVEKDTGTDLNWGVFAWPGEGEGFGSFVRSDVLCVSSGSKNPQAAFDFIMLLCTGEFDQLRADVSGGIPADPANESAIAGAAELLNGAGTFDGNLPEGMATEMFTKLWEKKYKTGLQFAKEWDKTR